MVKSEDGYFDEPVAARYDESYPEIADHPVTDVIRRTRAARTELDPIDVDDEGQSDYSGELIVGEDGTKIVIPLD